MGLINLAFYTNDNINLTSRVTDAGKNCAVLSFELKRVMRSANLNPKSIYFWLIKCTITILKRGLSTTTPFDQGPYIIHSSTHGLNVK